MAEESKQPEAVKPNPVYQLSDKETATFQFLSQNVVLHKMRVYACNEQMDRLKQQCDAELREVEAAQKMIDGAISLLCDQQGFKQAQLSPDLKTLTATVL